MATDEQIERVRTMLECCDDWDADEQAAVETLLEDYAKLKRLAETVREYELSPSSISMRCEMFAALAKLTGW